MKCTRTAVAFVTGLAALTLAACGPAGTQSAGSGTPAVTSTPTTYVSPSPSISPSPVPSTTAPPSTSPASVPVTRHATTAAPRHTTARPVHHTSAPPAHRTTAPAASGVCSIRSNAGNCYHAGQFCRNADLGETTTDANGRSIKCGMVSGRAHWHY